MTAAYRALATPENLQFLAEQTGYGVLFGLAGYVLLWILAQIKRRHPAPYGADQVYFLAAPVVAFTGAVALGGSGFLAAFVAGLLFHGQEHMKEIERFFYQVIDGVAKPVIFLLVGAMVDVHALIAYAPLGIAAALIFMFVLRPAMVFLMLGIYGLFPDSPRGLSVRELLFISFVRETGAIPAVLLVTAVGADDHAGERPGRDRDVGDPADADDSRRRSRLSSRAGSASRNSAHSHRCRITPVLVILRKAVQPHMHPRHAEA